MEKSFNIPSDVKLALTGYFTGEFTDHDSQILNSWLQEEEHNKLLFDQLVDIWQAGSFHNFTGKIDAEKAWKEIQSEIFKNKKKSATQKFSLLKFAAVFIMAFILGGLGYYFLKSFQDNMSKTTLVQHSAPIGSRTFIITPDSSRIWLNAGTILSYNNTFNNHNREVYLSGEAYFEIKRKEKLPFIVNTEDVSVRVLGTSFMITSYPEDEMIQTYLEKGEIMLEVEDENKEFQMLPGEQVVYQKTSKQLDIIKNVHPNIAAWRYGKIYFHNKPLKDIAKNIERCFGVKIRIATTQLEQVNLTMEFEEEGIDEILNYISKIANVQIIKENKQYVIKPK